MLQVSNLYKKRSESTGISDLSFRADAGEIIALLGPNGSGKSTTLKVIAGYLKPDRGSIKIESGVSAVSYLPEKVPHYPNLTVLETIKFFSKLTKVDLERQSYLIDILEINKVYNSFTGTLSKGWLQRLGLLVTLMTPAQVVLLDEPSSGLDPILISKIHSVIKSLAKDCVFIVSSHSLSEVFDLCTRAIFLKNGELLGDINLSNLEQVYVEQTYFQYFQA